MMVKARGEEEKRRDTPFKFSFSVSTNVPESRV